MGEPLVALSEERWIRAAKGGDLEAFNSLVDAYQNVAYTVALRTLGHGEDAADATQEAFASAFRGIATFRGGSFKAWLIRIVVNACYDLLRRRRQTVSLDEEPSEGPAIAVPDHADRAVAAADVQRALMMLPVEFRAVLIMHELQDLPLEEISATLEIPVGTVKSRLHRGRAALGRALAGEPRGAKAASKRPTR